MKNQSLLAVIREAECIGCTKCIQACPVDAIVGAQQQMHTVIAQECIGCQLCVAPCPVDCIELIAIPLSTIELRHSRAQLTRKRVQARKQRLQENHLASQQHITPAARKLEIAAILERTRNLNSSIPPLKSKLD